MATRFDGGRGGSTAKTMAAMTNPQFRLPGTGTTIAPIGTGTVLKPTGSGTVLKPTRPVSSAPAPVARSGGGGGGGGSYGGGGGGGGGYAPMSSPAAPAPPSEGDYLNSDDVYLAALSRYNKNYDDLLADVTRRQGDYDVTHKNSLEDLGFLGGGENGAPAQWDFENQQSAAGRGFQGLIQDFAARGLLHSGDYLGAQNDFVGSLGKQLGAMNTAKQQFGEGLNQEKTTGLSSRDAGIGQARAEALARMQQLYGAI